MENIMKRRIVITLLLSVFLTAWLDPFRDEVSEGNKKYHEKKYPEAEEKYKNASNYAPGEKDRKKLRFNQGDASYMKGEHDTAIENFKNALQSEDRDVQKKAFFNMGNTYLKKGDIDGAVNSFISALKIDPDYAPAKKNIEYIMNRKKNSEKDETNKKKSDSDNKGKSEKDKNESGKDDKGDKNRKSANMSKEQIMNIMNSMKDKPVRRERGKKDGERFLEKNW
jgi:Ca-activated chloride channel family protein